MRTTGIIAEYNPFHNGHLYQLRTAREITGADYVIVIMSGDYTQRGTPAIYSKYFRAKTALMSGADLVLEMPVYGSVASAPDFAACGINSLQATGVCDFLCFGSESGDMEALMRQADALSDESPEISARIREGLRSGLPWPAARAAAYADTPANQTGDGRTQGHSDDPAILPPTLPNDILGIEYIRALRAIRSDIEPVTIRRTDPGYHSEEKSGRFASATAVRKAILAQDLDFLTEVLPEAHFTCLQDSASPPVTFDDCSLLLNAKLLGATLDDLERTAAMPRDLANKLYKNRMEFLSASALVAARKDRNYTYTRINRSLLNFMLGITKEDTDHFKSCGSVPWLRILGFRKDAAPLLSELKKRVMAPIITKTANAGTILDGESRELFEKHLQCAELYRLLSESKAGHPQKNEYTHSVIIVP